MIKYLLPLFFSVTTLFSLEISINKGNENSSEYAIFHIKDKNYFTCSKELNDFNNITKIICTFDKKPKSLIRDFHDDYFDVTTSFNKTKFYINIKILKKAKMQAMVFDLKKDDEIFHADVTRAKEYVITSYKDSPPFVSSDIENDLTLAMPVKFENSTLYIGSLDINSNPVKIQRVEDVSEYLEIKKFYKIKKYDHTLELIDELETSYPNSIFNNEIAIYKIRSYANLKSYENVIELGKVFVRKYASDENIPEVLAYLAKAYSKMGLNIDADYFFDRLFSEHTDSKYVELGYIFKAEQLEATGSSKKAIKYYKKAINNTKDMEIASIAADHMVRYYMDLKRFKKASEIIYKLIKGNPSYLKENRARFVEYAYSFSDIEDLKTASSVAGTILKQSTKKYDRYEKLYKDYAIWLSKLDDTTKALDALNTYLKDYKYGSYVDQITTAKDELFFSDNDSNISAKFEKYDYLMNEYKGSEIADKALYKKAKLCFDNAMYSDVLGLNLSSLDKEVYKDVDSIVLDSKIELIKSHLDSGECSGILSYLDFIPSDFTLDYDSKLFKCLVDLGKYKKALIVSEKYIKQNNYELKREWLLKKADVDFKISNYKTLQAESKDLSLMFKRGSSQWCKSLRYYFDASKELGDKSILDTITKLESSCSDRFKDIGRYKAVFNYAAKIKDDVMLSKYASIIMKEQKDKNAYIYTPSLEFIYFQSLVNLGKNNDAIKVLKSLSNKDSLTSDQKAKLYYMLGSTYQKEKNVKEAKRYYKKSIDSSKDSSYSKLSADAIKLI